MKRLLILPVALLIVACEPVDDPQAAPAPTDPSTKDETRAPARGAKFKIVDGKNFYIREWQHPGTGCWYLLGTGDASGLSPLNDTNGQVCESTSQALTR